MSRWWHEVNFIDCHCSGGRCQCLVNELCVGHRQGDGTSGSLKVVVFLAVGIAMALGAHQPICGKRLRARQGAVAEGCARDLPLYLASVMLRCRMWTWALFSSEFGTIATQATFRRVAARKSSTKSRFSVGPTPCSRLQIAAGGGEDHSGGAGEGLVFLGVLASARERELRFRQQRQMRPVQTMLGMGIDSVGPP